MNIHIYTRPPQPWDDAGERAIRAGYTIDYIAGSKALDAFGRKGGPFAVFKNGALVARFPSPVERDKWLHRRLTHDH